MRVRASRIDAELAAQRGIAGEDSRLPAAVVGAQSFAEERIQRAQLVGLADALAVGRVHGDEAGRRRRRRQLLQLAALEEKQLLEARARRIRLGITDRDRVAVEAADAPWRQQRRPGVAHRRQPRIRPRRSRRAASSARSRSARAAGPARCRPRSARPRSASVPEPHIGSTNEPPAAAIAGQPERIRIAAARFSLSGAAPCPPR